MLTLINEFRNYSTLELIFCSVKVCIFGNY